MLVKNFRKPKIYGMHKWELEQLTYQIGKLFQLHRLRKGLSQFQIGNELDFSSNHIGRMERGKTNPTIGIISKLCNFLEIDLLVLFKKLDDKELQEIEKEIDDLQKKFKNQNKRKS